MVGIIDFLLRFRRLQKHFVFFFPELKHVADILDGTVTSTSFFEDCYSHALKVFKDKIETKLQVQDILPCYGPTLLDPQTL